MTIGTGKSLWRRFRQRYWLSLVADAAILMLAIWLIHTWQTRHLPDTPPTQQVNLASLDGALDVALLQPGEQGVVYFFAPWCGYCKASIDNLDTLLADGKIGWARAVALDYSSLEEVRDFVADTGIELPVLLGQESTARNWAIRAFPTYFIIDAEGRISSRSVGYSTWLGLRLRTLGWF